MSTRSPLVSRDLIHGVVCAGMLMGLAGTVWAQAATPGAPAMHDATPAVPGAAEKKKNLEIGPYLTTSQPKDYNLSVRVRVLRGTKETQYTDAFDGRTVTVKTTEAFDPIKSIAMIWPMLPSSASAEQRPNTLTGRLMFDDTVVTTEFKPMRNYPGGVEYARFDALASGTDFTPKKVELEVTIPMTVSKTDFDETAALKVDWPTSWPAQAQSWLAPQLYVETGFDENHKIQSYKPEAVEKAVKMALDRAGVSDAKNVSPVAAAKILTSFVWEHVQIVGQSSGKDGFSGEVPPFRLSAGEAFGVNDFGGVIVKPPEQTLLTERGTEYDASALLTAMLKKVGIPAHPVIGYDRGSGSSGRDQFTGKSRSGRGLKCWVEFALFDQPNNTINWIPIDIAKLNKSSSRPQKLERPWRYFGTNDELNGVLPIAFHFHPPTDVVSYGAPAFWGWFVTPKAPEYAGQALMFSASAMSKRASDMGDSPQDFKADEKKKAEEKKAADEKKRQEKKDEKKKKGY